MAIKLTPGTLQQKNVALTVNIAGQLYEVFARTSANNVLVDPVKGTTLKDKLQALAEEIADIKSEVSSSEIVEEKIQEAVDSILDGAAENYDTLKEIQTFIEEHADELADLSDLADALNERIPDTDDTTEVGAVLTHTADGNVWDKVLKVIDVDTVADLGTALASQVKVGQLGVVILEDEPQAFVYDANGEEVEVDDIATFLTTSDSEGTVTLNESVIIPKDTALTFKGTINLNGYTMEVAQ